MRALVIFDWDGTLMDSMPRIVASMQAAARDMGLEVPEETRVHGVVGLGLPEAIASLFPGIEQDALERLRQYYARHYIEGERVPSRLFPGAAEMLDGLRARGVGMAVATGKSRRGLERVWRHSGLGRYFVTSRCSDESISKPDPAMVTAILRETRVAPEQALVVGDTTFDMEMARRADVARVGVTWGAHEPELLMNHSPLALVDEMHELMEFLHEQWRP